MDNVLKLLGSNRSNEVPRYHCFDNANIFRFGKLSSTLMQFAVFLSATLFLHCAQAANDTITLNDALAKTLASNPRLKSLSYQEDSFEGRVLQAGLAPNPELSIEVEDMLGSGDFEGVDNAQTTLSLAWALERGLRKRYIGKARAQLSQWHADANAMRLEVTVETARRYLTCLANQKRYKHSQNAVQLAETTVKAIKERVSAGRAPTAELARAEAELAQRQLAREDFEHDLLTANYRLAAQWGERQPLFSSVGGDLFSLPKPMLFEHLKSRVDNNPEFARLLSAQRVHEAELSLAKAERKPSWRLSTGIRRFEGSNDEAFTLGLTIPLGINNQNQGRIQEAQANISGTVAETDTARLRIETTLFEFYQELQHSLHIANTMREQVIPTYERALKETQHAYESGRYGYQEWRSVQADLIQARSALIEASIEAHRNLIEIEYLTGVPIAQQGVSP